MEECNLTVYEGAEKKEKKKSKYSDLMGMARGIAEDMSDGDRVRLQANPTPEMLKKIMEKNA